MPRSRATCRCGTPSATSRRIRAQSSTEITHPICLGGLVFDRRYGLVFNRRRHGLTPGAAIRREPPGRTVRSTARLKGIEAAKSGAPALEIPETSSAPAFEAPAPCGA